MRWCGEQSDRLRHTRSVCATKQQVQAAQLSPQRHVCRGAAGQLPRDCLPLLLQANAAAAADGVVSNICLPSQTVRLRSPIQWVGGQRSWHGRFERPTYFRNRRKIGSSPRSLKGFDDRDTEPTKHVKHKRMGNVPIVLQQFCPLQKGVFYRATNSTNSSSGHPRFSPLLSS